MLFSLEFYSLQAFLCEFKGPFLEKIIVFLESTVKSLVRVIANDKVLLKI